MEAFTVTTLIADEAIRADEDIRPAIQLSRRTLPRVACAIFACPRCNWPLVGVNFTSCTDDDFHDEVFELTCSECEWREAMLGRDALDRMIVNWRGRNVMRLIRGA
jgi:RNase P subunit RPR2